MQEQPVTKKLEVEKILSRKSSAGKNSGANKIHYGRVIRGDSSSSQHETSTVRVIGGDSLKNDDCAPPTIIIEKDTATGELRRILVRCPCGRESELLCEYDEDQE